MAALTSSLDRQRSEFHVALKNLRNTCRRIQGAADERWQDRQRDRVYVQLEQDLAASDGLAPRMLLRRKPDVQAAGGFRIVPLRSRSLLKNLLCIGAGKRNEQARALADRHGLAAAPAVTRANLLAANHHYRCADQFIALREARSAATESLRSTLETALRRAAANHADNLPAITAGCNDLMARLVSAVGIEAFRAAADDVAEILEELHQVLTAPVREQRDRLESKLDTIVRAAQERQREGEATRRAALGDGRLPTRSHERLVDDLARLHAECAFSDVFHTEAGCRAMQAALVGQTPSDLGSQVVTELRARHGDDVFCYGPADREEELKASADKVSPRQMATIDAKAHEAGLAAWLEGHSGYLTLYRQADHSQAMIDRLEGMAGSGQLLQPTRLMSTSTADDASRRYPAQRQDGLLPVRFTVSGFSALPVPTQWSTRSEAGERLFSTHARFEVNAVSRDAGSGTWLVELKERPVGLDAAPGVPLDL